MNFLDGTSAKRGSNVTSVILLLRDFIIPINIKESFVTY